MPSVAMVQRSANAYIIDMGKLFDSHFSNNDILINTHLTTFEPIDKYIVYNVKNSITFY